MSKYTRTKNNVYEVKEEKEYFYITTTGQMPFKKDVIKEADTIEELCDEFVIDNPDSFEKKPFVASGNIEKYDRNYAIEHEIKIYGCIWCSKGLIYVAKVNEKGDLELI